MKLTFTQTFTYEIDDRTSRTFPQGWSGEVDDDVAELAIDAGVVDEAPKPKAAKKADKTPAEPPADEGKAPA